MDLIPYPNKLPGFMESSRYSSQTEYSCFEDTPIDLATLQKEAVEAKLAYLRDVNDPEEFDELVGQELRFQLAKNTEKKVEFRPELKRIIKKIFKWA